MKVSELIKYLEYFNPDLPVYVASSDHDFDWMVLHSEFVYVKLITIDESQEPEEIKALCLGDGHQ